MVVKYECICSQDETERLLVGGAREAGFMHKNIRAKEKSAEHVEDGQTVERGKWRDRFREGLRAILNAWKVG